MKNILRKTTNFQFSTIFYDAVSYAITVEIYLLVISIYGGAR